MGDKTNNKRMSMIVTKGSLDWAYPPFILATTAAAMGLDVTMFFTFYGLTLLKKKLDLKISTLGNPAMEIPMFGMHIGMPNLVSTIPGVDAAATTMMKNLIKKKGVASIEDSAQHGAGGRCQDDRLSNDYGFVRVHTERHHRGSGAWRRRHLYRNRDQERHQPVHLIEKSEEGDMADQVLDVKGLNCPLPILRAKKALRDVPTGGTLQVLATDPGAVKDFEAFCRTTGNELLESKAENKVFSFVIKRTS